MNTSPTKRPHRTSPPCSPQGDAGRAEGWGIAASACRPAKGMRTPGVLTPSLGMVTGRLGCAANAVAPIAMDRYTHARLFIRRFSPGLVNAATQPMLAQYSETG